MAPWKACIKYDSCATAAGLVGGSGACACACAWTRRWRRWRAPGGVGATGIYRRAGYSGNSGGGALDGERLRRGGGCLCIEIEGGLHPRDHVHAAVGLVRKERVRLRAGKRKDKER